MPELPEVETIRLGLQKYLVGHTIIDIDIRLKKQFQGDPKDIKGTKVTGVRRFGKGLVIDLYSGFSLAIHVKMTGQLVYRRVSGVSGVSGEKRGSELDIDKLPDKYTHVVFHLEDESFLFYRDIRQFGWIKVVKSSKLEMQSFFKNLGPEPLKDLTLKKFSDIVGNSKMPIKQVLMDQAKIAGIGNIYANDALFEAKIHPKRAAFSLTKEEIAVLFGAIEKVLLRGLDAGGASQWNYVDVLGQKGEYQNFFQVYNREGEVCKRCGGKIERIKMGGRGTFFCPFCQK